MIPVSQTLPDVNLDEILATLDADTRDYLRAAAQRRRRGPRLRGQGPAAGAGDPAPGADREVRARDQRAAGAAAPQPRARGAQLLAADRRARPARHAARELRPELQRGLRHAGRRRTSRCGRSCRSCRARCRRRRRRWARSTRSRRCSGRRSSRCARRRARSARRCARRARSCASRRRSSATRSARSRARRCRRCRSCARRCATWRRSTPDLTASFSVLNRLLNTIAYNPPGDKRGGLPLLAVVGQPRRQRDLLDRRRARPDPARPGRAVVLERAAAGRRRGRQPAAGHDHRAAQRALGPADLPAVDGAARERRHRWLRTLPPSARSRRWCCSRCRASGCCCSCGWPSAARCR